MSFSLPHLMQPPANPLAAAPSGRAPLLLLLHGIGSNETDLIGLAPYLDPRFCLVSVRAPITLQEGAYAWFELGIRPQGLTVNTTAALASLQLLIQFIDQMVDHYPVDPQQVFLMGFSQGAMMSLSLALTAPEKVAGVVAMSGCLLPEMIPSQLDPSRLEHLPILMVHGRNDEVVPLLYAESSRRFLETLPIQLTYQDYEMGHQVSGESLMDIRLWLDQQIGSSAKNC